MSSTSPCFSFLNDQDIVNALRNGDSTMVNEAMKCLDSYKPQFLNHIINKFKISYPLNSPEVLKDLEDLYQDTMLVVYENLIKVDQDGEHTFIPGAKASIKTYFFTCGKYIYIKKIEKLAKLQAGNEGYAQKLKTEMLLNLLRDEKEENAAKVQQAIKELKEKCRELLDLRYNEDLELKEIVKRINEKLAVEDAGKKNNEGLPPAESIVQEQKNANNVAQKLLRCRDELKDLLISKYGFPDSFI